LVRGDGVKAQARARERTRQPFELGRRRPAGLERRRRRQVARAAGRLNKVLLSRAI
jgi:hypothetical protein